MEKSTIDRLNQLNLQFYEQVANEFSDSRSYAWVGWTKLFQKILPLRLIHQPRILDVGCGNGRWAEFLAGHYEKFTYLGIDSSKKLLKLASSKAIFGERSEDLSLREFNLLTLREKAEPPIFGQFDIVVAFGVLHHVPSFQLRHQLMELLVANVKPGGLIMVTAWQFMSDPKLKARVVDFPEIGIKAHEVESDDYLLDWRRGERTLRYCHLTSEIEMRQLVKDLGVTLVDQFAADGQSGQLNDYYIFKRENQSKL